MMPTTRKRERRSAEMGLADVERSPPNRRYHGASLHDRDPLAPPVRSSSSGGVASDREAGAERSKIVRGDALAVKLFGLARSGQRRQPTTSAADQRLKRPQAYRQLGVKSRTSAPSVRH